MKVLAMNRGDASSYYRTVAPFAVLRMSEGVDVTFRASLNFALAAEYDVLWLQMDAGSDVEMVAHEFKRRGKHVIYDVDDWLFAYPPSWLNYDAYFQRGTGHPTTLLESHTRLLELADVVTTTTPYLAAKLRQYNENVVVLPNCVVQGDWDTILPARHNLKGPVVGWFGTGNHWEEWYELAPALDEALAAIDWYLALTGAPEMLACFPPRLAERTYWTPLVPMRDFEQIRQMITTFDVGLAWATDRLETARCRSPLKAIQYGAAGVPVFASKTVYGDILGEDYGLTFTSPQALAEALIGLYKGGMPRSWRVLTAEWKTQVWQAHTYETQAGRWMEVLKRLDG